MFVQHLFTIFTKYQTLFSANIQTIDVGYFLYYNKNIEKTTTNTIMEELYQFRAWPDDKITHYINERKEQYEKQKTYC